MRNLQLHIILSVLAMFFAVTAHGQFSENFNSKTEAQLESECWNFNDMDVSSTTGHLNSGADAPHIHGDVNVLLVWGSSPSLTTPFLYFDGNDDVSFKHGFDGFNFALFTGMQALLVNENGAETPIYGKNGTWSSETVNLTTNVVGYYRVRWRYGALLGFASLVADVDDFSTTASIIAPTIEADTACENEMNVIYEFGFPTTSAIYYYDWSFTGASGGDITPLTGNQRKAQVDWTAGPGNYQIVAKEYTDAAYTNCTGRESYYDIYVHAIPDVQITLDTACEGEDYVLDLEFEGIAPWTMKYKIDGGGNQTRVFNSVNEVFNLSWGTTSLEITQLTDGGPCGKNNNLPIYNSLYSYPKPNTDPIYHY